MLNGMRVCFLFMVVLASDESRHIALALRTLCVNKLIFQYSAHKKVNKNLCWYHCTFTKESM